MPKPDYNQMIEWLSLILRCPICSNKYTADKTSIIETREPERGESPSVLVHSDCEACKSSVVFSLSLEGPEIFSVGMVTDLTSNDTKKFNKRQSISADDVLDFHEFLKKFDGNFEKILK